MIPAGYQEIVKKLIFILIAGAAFAQDNASVGRKVFENRCSGCHGADGNGGELGPPIARRVANLSDAQIISVVRNGIPSAGMPANNVGDQEMPQLVSFLHTLRPRGFGFGFRPYHATLKLSSGRSLDGMIVNESFADAQMRTSDGAIHLLRKSDGGAWREVTSEVNWSTYNGDIGGNRYTKLSQITKQNVKQLGARWMFTLNNAGRLQGTPVVVDGVMYVTAANECYALDAGSGRQIWHFERPRTRSLVGNAAGGINRGVAVAGDKVFMVTDNAHILALKKSTGELAWETEMADWKQNYNATSAPLAIHNLVITGTAGGEEGVRGFLAGYDQQTGKEVWRFWTVPAPGEPGSESWKGNGWRHGGAPTWFTGTYDAETDTLFWGGGNPGEDYNGDDREGDDLYSDCILALDPNTGKLKWHYQTTPHDVWDWDTAGEPGMVVDANWKGEPRKLLLEANRNGFFYVFDRTNGKLLLARQFIDRLTWAKGIGEDGRPIKNPGQEPSEKGTEVCPSQDGATNWFSPSYSPSTGLFYMQTFEKCSIYTKRPAEWEAGHAFLGGAQRVAPDYKPRRILRAIDPQTGERKWQVEEIGLASSWGGTLATASGVLFYGDDSGAFVAADAASGKHLWDFQTSQLWKASPMTYQFDGRQYVAVAAGSAIIAFGLPE